MRKDQFISFMDAPEKITGEGIALLEGLVQEFPYCQTAQLLLAKALNNDNSIRYGNQLKIAAAYAGDRKALYQLIMRKPHEAVAAEEKQEAASPLVMPDNDDELLNNLVISAEEELEVTLVSEEKEEEIKSIEEPGEIPAATGTPVITMENEPPVIEEPVKEDEKVEEQVPAAEEPATAEEPIAEMKEEQQEEKENSQTPAVTDLPPLEQNIIVKAIDASIELEVSEKMPYNEEPEQAVTAAIENEGSTAEETTSTAEVQEEEEKFDPATTHSFTEWLKHAKKAKAGEAKEQDENKEKEEPVQQEGKKVKTRKTIDDLIDKFIMEEPKITRPSPKQEFYSPVNMARQSVQDDNEFVTETLANIYLKQGSYAKALKAYETLSLKFPEKKLYFAARIKEIKKIIKEQK